MSSDRSPHSHGWKRPHSSENSESSAAEDEEVKRTSAGEKMVPNYLEGSSLMASPSSNRSLSTERISSPESEYAYERKPSTDPITSPESEYSDDEEEEEKEVEIFVPPDGIRNNPKFLRTEDYFSRPIPPPYDAVPEDDDSVDLDRLFGGHIFPNLTTAGRATGWAQYDKLLGRGAYGSVYLGFKYCDRNLPNSERPLCAIKKIPCYRKIPYCRADKVEGMFKMVWTEVMIMRCLTHAHIVRFGAAYMVKPKIAEESTAHIVMEFCDAGSLQDEIIAQGYHVMAIPAARFYFRHVASAIKYMHDKGISHGDLHCANVLMKYKFDGVCKKCLLADFGLASICWSKVDDDDGNRQPEFSQLHTVSGTVCHLSPEKSQKVYLYPGDTDPFTISGAECLSSDIWNMGSMLHKMVSGSEPMLRREVRLAYPKRGPECSSDIKDPDTAAFINRLLADADVRPTASLVWDDGWMKKDFHDPGFQPHPDDPLY